MAWDDDLKNWWQNYSANQSADVGNPVWDPNAEGFDWSNMGTTPDFGFNQGTLKGVGSVLSGVGSLGQAWAGLQNVKLSEQALANQMDQWSKNYENQVTTINNQIRDQNAWKAAQGRTDFAQLLPTKQNIG